MGLSRPTVDVPSFATSIQNSEIFSLARENERMILTCYKVTCITIKWPFTTLALLQHEIETNTVCLIFTAHQNDATNIQENSQGGKKLCNRNIKRISKHHRTRAHIHPVPCGE